MSNNKKYLVFTTLFALLGSTIGLCGFSVLVANHYTMVQYSVFDCTIYGIDNQTICDTSCDNSYHLFYELNNNKWSQSGLNSSFDNVFIGKNITCYAQNINSMAYVADPPTLIHNYSVAGIVIIGIFSIGLYIIVVAVLYIIIWESYTGREFDDTVNVEETTEAGVEVELAENVTMKFSV